MFRSILVPLDGSVFAEHALPLAVSLARHTGTTLRLLRVVPPLADYFFWAPEPGDPLENELRQVHRTSAQTYLDGVVRRVREAGSGPVACDVIEEDEGLTEAICADVARTGADLIVLTSHGRGPLARFWLGSVADKLVRLAPVPVLLVRPQEHPPAPDLQTPVLLKHLVLALDGTAMAEGIVEPALAIGKAMGADYTLIRVVQPAFAHLLTPGGAAFVPLAEPGKIEEQQRQQAEDYLRTVAERLRADGAVVQTRIHVAEQPAAAILEEAALVGADLIALETHGRGFSRLLMGSVADNVVRGSALPILVCRLPQPPH